jgi:hypothetical protein
MKTVTVDDRQRVRLPDAKPGDVLAYENQGSTITLTKIEPSKPKGAWLVKVNGRTYAMSDHTITNEDVKRELENFP